MRPPHSGSCVSYPANRYGSCLKCGKPYHEPVPDTPESRDMGRPRALKLERHLTRLAHEAAGIAVPLDPNQPTSLDVYADWRCDPGPVRMPRDFMEEARQELGDARNYLVWEACANWLGYAEGDAVASHHFEHAMRVLGKVAEAWRELHTTAS